MPGQLKPAPPKRSKFERAQGLVDDAWEKAEGSPARSQLARRALRLDRDNIDAHNILAWEAPTVAEKLALLERAVRIAETATAPTPHRHLGTRPYFRALQGLMLVNWELEQFDIAISIGRKLLRVDQRDGRGARYVLMAIFANLGRWRDLERQLTKSRGDQRADALYARVLLALADGDHERADRLVIAALEENRHVPDALAGRLANPSDGHSNIVGLGVSVSTRSPAEAMEHARAFCVGWARVPGAVAWLAVAARRTQPHQPA